MLTLVSSLGSPATRTARDGTFAIRLARGDKLDLRVVAAAFGDVVREDCQAGERVVITLRRGATLDVTTVDESGAPVSGVHVKVRRDTRAFGPVAQTREGVTDAAGHVAITGLLPGPATVDSLHATLGEPTWQRPSLPATGTLTIHLMLPAARQLNEDGVEGRISFRLSGPGAETPFAACLRELAAGRLPALSAAGLPAELGQFLAALTQALQQG